MTENREYSALFSQEGKYHPYHPFLQRISVSVTRSRVPLEGPRSAEKRGEKETEEEKEG